MTVFSAFQPHFGTNQTVTSTSTAVTIGIDQQDKTVMIYNSGTQMAYIHTSGNADVVAVSADFPCAGGSFHFIEKGMGQVKYLSHVCPSGSSVLDIMTGEGMF